MPFNANQFLDNLLVELTSGKERPPADTGNKFLDSVLDFVTPRTASEAMASSVPFAGTIAPATWRAMAPQAKAMLTRLADAFPESFARVLQHPRELMAFIGGLEPGVAGSIVRSEFPIAGKTASVRVAQSEAPKLQTPTHEILGHFLGEERLAKTAPRSQEMFGMLEDVLPLQTTGSLRLRTGQLRNLRELGMPESVLGATPTQRATYESDLQRVIMDEALASLAEAQTMPNVNPLVRQLAEGLGLVLK